MSLYLPRFSHLTGSLAGLAGFAVVLGNDSKDNLARLPGCTSKATALAGCFAATALSHWMCPPQATATAKGHRPVYTPHTFTRGAFVCLCVQAIFVTGTVMVGLSETFSSMQGYCKAE